MISKALKKEIKIILLTPSPDQRVNILEPNNELEQHAKHIKRLSEENGIGLIDSYELFKNKVVSGDSISIFMSQVNHPNKIGLYASRSKTRVKRGSFLSAFNS